MPKVDLLFVYGTLRRGSGHPMSRFLARRADIVGPGRMSGRMYDLADYPGAIHDPSSQTAVAGEIVRLREPDSSLPILDGYEDVQASGLGEFRRELCPVKTADGQEWRCWVYTLNRPVDGLRAVPNGEFETGAERAPADLPPETWPSRV